MTTPATAEGATLPRLNVAGRDFEIGPVSIHQLLLLKNLVVSVTQATIAIQAKRQAELATTTAKTMQHLDDAQKTRLAERLGVAVDDVENVAYANQVFGIVFTELAASQGVSPDSQISAIMDALSGMSEDQLTDIAVILLNRKTQSGVTHDWVKDHFALDWFFEALAMLIETNNIPSIIKNFQRLIAATSMHLSMQQSAVNS